MQVEYFADVLLQSGMYTLQYRCAADCFSMVCCFAGKTRFLFHGVAIFYTWVDIGLILFTTHSLQRLFKNMNDPGEVACQRTAAAAMTGTAKLQNPPCLCERNSRSGYTSGKRHYIQFNAWHLAQLYSTLLKNRLSPGWLMLRYQGWTSLSGLAKVVQSQRSLFASKKRKKVNMKIYRLRWH